MAFVVSQQEGSYTNDVRVENYDENFISSLKRLSRVRSSQLNEGVSEHFQSCFAFSCARSTECKVDRGRVTACNGMRKQVRRSPNCLPTKAVSLFHALRGASTVSKEFSKAGRDGTS